MIMLILLLLILNEFLLYVMCMYVFPECIYEYHMCAHKAGKAHHISLSFILVVVSCQMWVIGTKLQPSVRAAGALTCWAVSPAPKLLFPNQKVMTDPDNVGRAILFSTVPAFLFPSPGDIASPFVELFLDQPCNVALSSPRSQTLCRIFTDGSRLPFQNLRIRGIK